MPEQYIVQLRDVSLLSCAFHCQCGRFGMGVNFSKRKIAEYDAEPLRV